MADRVEAESVRALFTVGQPTDTLGFAAVRSPVPHGGMARHG